MDLTCVSQHKDKKCFNQVLFDIILQCTITSSDSPVLEHGRGALHDVGQAGKDEPPARDERDGVREARAQSEMQVLNQHLLEGLQ